MKRLVSGWFWGALGLGALLGACDASTSSNSGAGAGARAADGGGPIGTGGTVFCAQDADDGYCGEARRNSAGYDCDDTDPARHAGATEELNGLDDDCNGSIDDGLEPACIWTTTEPPSGCEVAKELVASAYSACSDCYAALSACSGASCYAEFLTCAGYPVDFAAYPLARPNTADCEGSGCISGARVGEPCKRPVDCMSGACRALPHTVKSSICVLSRSVTYANGSPYCYCGRTTDTGSFCDQ